MMRIKNAGKKLPYCCRQPWEYLLKFTIKQQTKFGEKGRCHELQELRDEF